MGFFLRTICTMNLVLPKKIFREWVNDAVREEVKNVIGIMHMENVLRRYD